MKNLLLTRTQFLLLSLLSSGLLFPSNSLMEEPVFRDDFDNNINSWTPTNEEAKKMNISEGWLWLPTKKYRAEVYCTTKEPINLSRDFEISFALKAAKADENEYFGLEVMGSKFVKALHTNKLIIQITTGGNIKLVQRLDDLKFPVNERITSTSIKKGEDAVNELKLTRIGDELKLTVNNETVLEGIPFSIENPTESFHRIALNALGDKMNIGVDYIDIKYLP